MADPVDNAVNSVIGRVAVVVVSLFAPVIAVGCAWLQDKIGINLNPTEVATLIGTTVAGVVALGYKWLHNRGEYERIVLELEKVYGVGKDAAVEGGAAPPVGQ